jgi:putative transposase
VMFQVKYLNNIVEQDHRATKRITKPMLNSKAHRCAGYVLAGVESMHIIRKGKCANDNENPMPFADLFYALACPIRPV